MEKMNIVNLEYFKQKLWEFHIEILDEFEYNDTYLIVLNCDVFTKYELLTLMGISPFNILLMYFDGNKKLHLQFFPNI